MNSGYNPRLVGISRVLRKNMTKEERRLWYDFLKTLPVTVNRQKVFGNYVADFYCASAKTVIELGGSQHYREKNAAADKERDAFFAALGITVLRYGNNEVNKNFDVVCQDIYNKIMPKDKQI